MSIPDDPMDKAIAKDKSSRNSSEPGLQPFDRGRGNRTGIAAKSWAGKISLGDEVYKSWEDDYQCFWLEQFYAGHHYQDQDDAANKYTGNRFFSSIIANRPALFFQRPKFRINPLPPFEDDPGSTADEKYQLLEDTTNTVLADSRIRFKQQVNLAVLDAYFRYGILMSGWGTDYNLNPNAGKPVQLEDSDSNTEHLPESEQPLKPLKPPPYTPLEERVFVRHIPARQFRVGAENRPVLEENEWCGFWEWVPLADAKTDKRFSESARRRLKSSGEWHWGEDKYTTRGSNSDRVKVSSSDSAEDSDGYERGMVLLWHIWHIRTSSYFVMAEGHKGFLMEPEEFEIFPFSELRFADLPDSFYPVPITYSWLSPQQERNEVMSDIRTHRQRFKRRALYDPTKVKAEQIKKLESGVDGGYAEVEAGVDPNQAFFNIPDAGLDPNTSNAWLVQVDRDFDQVAGIGADQRGAGGVSTATAAAIVDARAQVRESYSRSQVAEFLASAATKVMKNLCKFGTAPLWIRLNADPQAEGFAQELDRVSKSWRKIQLSGEDGFDELNYEIETDIATMAPLTKDMEKADWFQCLGLVSNPTIVQILAASPYLLKKTFGFFNVTNSRELQELQTGMENTIKMQQALAQQQAGGSSGGGASAGGPSGTPAAGGGGEGGVVTSSPQQDQILARVSAAANTLEN